MGTGNDFKSDLYRIFNYVQNALIIHPRDLILESLRDFFSADSYYRYQRDAWGFPKTPDHTDLPSTAGLDDDITTRLFIGEPYRDNLIYYPAILVKSGGSRSVPLSFNRNKGYLHYKNIEYIDGYGNSTIINTPSYFEQSGAWEGQVVAEIEARSPRARDELADLVSILFVDTFHERLIQSGVLIKGVSTSGPSDVEDRNDKLHKVSVTFDIRSEWHRQIPVERTVDIINICVEFANNLEEYPEIVSPNLTINSTVELVNELNNL